MVPQEPVQAVLMLLEISPTIVPVMMGIMMMDLMLNVKLVLIHVKIVMDLLPNVLNVYPILKEELSLTVPVKLDGSKTPNSNVNNVIDNVLLANKPHLIVLNVKDSTD
jgi:hypothetical protein